MHTQLFKYIHVCTQNDKYRIKDDTHSKIKKILREKERDGERREPQNLKGYHKK